MSHVIDYQPSAAEQKIRHLSALAQACECIMTNKNTPALRLRLAPGATIGADGRLYVGDKLLTKGHERYRTWKTDHGNLAGDYDVPPGMTEAEVGANAVAVIELTLDAKAQVGSQAYEVGVIPRLDPQTGEMTYSLTHDFYANGCGLETFIGQTVVNRNKKIGEKSYEITEAHGNLLMFYQMMVAKIAAEEVGHSIEFEAQKDGSYTAYIDKENHGLVAQ